MRKWLHNVGIALDQLLNALTGGDPDETICSRVAKEARKGGSKVSEFLRELLDEVFGPKHCDSSIEEDEGKDGL